MLRFCSSTGCSSRYSPGPDVDGAAGGADPVEGCLQRLVAGDTLGEVLVDVPERAPAVTDHHGERAWCELAGAELDQPVAHLLQRQEPDPQVLELAPRGRPRHARQRHPLVAGARDGGSRQLLHHALRDRVWTGDPGREGPVLEHAEVVSVEGEVDAVDEVVAHLGEQVVDAVPAPYGGRVRTQERAVEPAAQHERHGIGGQCPTGRLQLELARGRVDGAQGAHLGAVLGPPRVEPAAPVLDHHQAPGGEGAGVLGRDEHGLRTRDRVDDQRDHVGGVVTGPADDAGLARPSARPAPRPGRGCSPSPGTPRPWWR